MKENKLRPWEDPRIIEINRRPMTANGTRYSDRKAALSGTDSDCYQSLNGSWNFHWIPSMASLPEVYPHPQIVVEEWAEIEVPGTWQTQGYGKPHYRNIGLHPVSMRKILPGSIPNLIAEDCIARHFLSRLSGRSGGFFCTWARYLLPVRSG